MIALAATPITEPPALAISAEQAGVETLKVLNMLLVVLRTMIAGQQGTLAVDAEALGKMLGLSRRTVRTMDSAGKLPRPIRWGHAVRWTLDGPNGIREWLAAGAPDRRTWEARAR